MSKNCCLIIIVILLYITQSANSQTIREISGAKNKIEKSIITNQKDKDQLKKTLQSFDKIYLREFLKQYDLSTKNKSKSELIGTILDNIPIFISKNKNLVFPIDSKKDDKSSNKRSDEIANAESKKDRNFLSYQAERIYAVDKEDSKGYKRILLFGNVKMIFLGKTLYADAVSVKVDRDNKPVEVVATGDLLIEDKSHNRIVGEKMYFFPQIQRGIFYETSAYNHPFYLTGKKGYLIDTGKYIFYDGMITSDDLLHPHYSLHYSKAWFYDEEILWAHNVKYKIGNTTLLYTPIFFRTQYSTGINTAFGYERGISWFIHNTFVYNPEDENYSMQVKLDYYQKMGLYLGYEFQYNEGLNKFVFDSAIAIDRALKYVGGSEILTNYFDQDGDGLPEETNNLRWRIKLEGDYELFNSDDGLRSALAFGFRTQGEPFFQSQFESRRKKDFEIWHLAGINKTDRSIEGASKGFSSLTGQELRFSLLNKIEGLSVSITGNFSYLLQRDDTNLNNPPNNPYKTDSYRNYKSIFTFPHININYSDTFQIFGRYEPVLARDKKKEEDQKKQKEQEYLKEFEKDGIYTTEKKEKSESSIQTELGKDEYLQPEVKRKNNVQINLPFIYSINYDFQERKYFNTTTDNNLKADVYNTISSITVNTPFTMTYQALLWNINPSASIFNYTQKTKNASASEDITDKELTYALWRSTISTRLELHFFDEYEYLELILGGGVNYSKSDRFDSIRRVGTSFKNEAGRGENFGVASDITFLKTKFGISYTDNLYISAADRERINQGLITEKEILRSQRGNLNFITESRTFDFLDINNTYVFSRSYDRQVSNLLSLRLKFLDRFKLFGPLYVNSLNHTLSWNNDFGNPRGSYFRSIFQLDFNFSRNWNFIYEATSVNNQLYRYSRSYSRRYGQESKNIFTDFADSFNFFDKSKRENSLFNLEKMTFKLQHDLHDWMMEFKVDLYIKQFRNGPYYYEPTIYLIIYLKDLPSFRYPSFQHTFTNG